MKFQELPIEENILKAINDIGYEEATYIQSACIPMILNGADVIGQSQTGTGKTAAFAIPIIQMIDQMQEKKVSKKPKTIILTPTRELAIQVANEIRKFAKYTENVKTVVLYGGAPIEKQIRELKGNNSIIVGTPGRIIDHINRHTLKLDECKTLVLDEADEMLNMGFREDIETIIQSLNADRQTVLFSATMPKPILEITNMYLTNPLHIKTPSKEITASKVEQFYYEVNQSNKRTALFQLLHLYPFSKAMVFCNTKKMVDDLCQDLVSKGYAACAIHGDLKQEQRLQVLDKFKKNLINILIATDVAARGIDISELDVVFNYDYPQEDEYYVHRIGRTGRAGKNGQAVTLITPRQRMLIKNIEKKTKAKVVKKELPNKEEINKIKINHLKTQIKEQLDIKLHDEVKGVLDSLCNDGYTYEEIACALIQKTLGKELFEEIKKPLESDTLIVTHKGTTKILIDVGRKQEIQPAYIVSAIAEASGLSGKDVGKIKIGDYDTVVEIPSQFDELILKSLQNTTVKGFEIHPRYFTAKPQSKSSNKKDEPMKKKNRRKLDDNKKPSRKSDEKKSKSKKRSR